MNDLALSVNMNYFDDDFWASSMQITNYFQLNNNLLTFTRQQASDFAKDVANDFNPIHDIDHSRFCVPGDLLFSVMIHHYGLRNEMSFKFSGMVGDSAKLILPACEGQKDMDLCDDKGKKYLSISCDGDISTNPVLIESLSRNYVEFSGQAFPHILVPLMSENNVMINPDRPLVMYDSMCLSLDTLDIDHVKLELENSELNFSGKRGDIVLNYIITSDGNPVGRGQKKMLLSGLREYDAEKMQQVVSYYDQRRENYTHSKH